MGEKQRMNENGPFFHGKAELSTRELLKPGYHSNFESKRLSNYIYFTASLDAAKWGAELAQGDGAERIYLVEPTGDFEDHPNLTDKRFPGNPTRSYRSDSALKIIGEVTGWERHTDEEIRTMLDHINSLRDSGLATIDD
ncbi:NAD(+)--rifampin ADP-ribosyltransferase [Alkalibacterium pelagium]|uniref:Rifampin ADP-ribosylating transferase n=1 Tax=Alkalibacterium pelagium TaxID=426702 RepID=A0A1H7KI89_9LACT|nr:NAD(+)--rifampin ADP-ribosyltransferase [Alkalibacterium pelagium]GEN50744.1 rifampin ADP-ribosyl transferase [Alkalibacterium pelagium]SEK86216.1 rifampin ADP-ribosylating transferase [Alkalibacterium pelagium]